MGAGEGRVVNLFRRLVLANGLVFTVGTLLLALLPLTVSAQVAEREAIVLALVVAWQALTIHSMFSSHSASGAPVLSVGWSWRPTGWEATYTDGTKAVHLVW